MDSNFRYTVREVHSGGESFYVVVRDEGDLECCVSSQAYRHRISAQHSADLLNRAAKLTEILENR